MGQRVNHGDVGARQQRQMIIGLHVRRLHEVNAPRIDDDELGALAQPPLHLRREHRVCVGGIRANDHDDVGMFHGIEVLRAGGGSKGCLHAIAGGRMADARARVVLLLPKAARTIF